MAGTLVVLGGGITGWILRALAAAESEDAPIEAVAAASLDCHPEVAAGQWGFTTRVSQGASPSAIGINGYYKMNVGAEEACNLHVAVEKLGFGRVRFEGERIQSGEASLNLAKGLERAWKGEFTLKGSSSAPRYAVTMFFWGDELFGVWRNTETEWDRSKMWGVLRGSRMRTPFLDLEDSHDQPCPVRCAIDCGLLPSSQGEIDARCIDACEARDQPRCP